MTTEELLNTETQESYRKAHVFDADFRHEFYLSSFCIKDKNQDLTLRRVVGKMVRSNIPILTAIYILNQFVPEGCEVDKATFKITGWTNIFADKKGIPVFLTTNEYKHWKLSKIA